ncbi:zinc finger protein ZAT3-like [Heracleum sosnowskyi]|uniref:Zinc finger protein ZAT3-like n=1 Tax=Heracleum sosnowskyi TaxID=360622 RepID=A0AAD8IF63_9APIA|nr:zinc finger protein ZAT3-like [Heracleum sosnowskyi]
MTNTNSSSSSSEPPDFTPPNSNDEEMNSPPLIQSQTTLSYSNDHNLLKKTITNPRKKRTKVMRIDNVSTASTSSNVGVSKPKYSKKPDPSAPKITRPCTECGKRFWSVKALFGHMRCHPERQWRGINPPPNLRQVSSIDHHRIGDDRCDQVSSVTQEDQHVASCLLLLANAPPLPPPVVVSDQTIPTSIRTNCGVGFSESEIRQHQNVVFCCGDNDSPIMDHGAGPSGVNSFKFECSSCKKVFGSHQALGGHRASHKNVKGCFAINKNIDNAATEDYSSIGGHENRNLDHGDPCRDQQDKMLMALGHRCSICLRVFPSGQALGGHKRCHWEKGEDPSCQMQGGSESNQQFGAKGASAVDLNLPALVDQDDHSSSSLTSGLCLDLRLGL